MKNQLIKVSSGLLIIAALFFAFGCKKKPKEKEPQKMTAEQDSILKIYEEPLTLGPDSTVITGLIADFEPERKAFQEAVNKAFPGLMKEYEKDAKAIMELKNENLEALEKDISTMLIAFDKKYKEKLMKAWDIAKIDNEVIASKYKKWLGNYAYERGDLGVITMPLIGPVPPPFPSDTTFNLGCPTMEVREQNSSCGLINLGPYVRLGNCNLFANSSGLYAGGCDVWGMLGRKVTVAAPVARVIAQCKGDYRLRAWAMAIGGGAAATSFVGAEIEKGGVIRANREHARIWAVAPIIWYAEVMQDRTAQDLTVGMRRSSGTPEEVNMKAYGRIGSGAGLIAGATGSASFTYRNGIQVSFNR